MIGAVSASALAMRLAVLTVTGRPRQITPLSVVGETSASRASWAALRPRRFISAMSLDAARLMCDSWRTVPALYLFFFADYNGPRRQVLKGKHGTERSVRGRGVNSGEPCPSYMLARIPPRRLITKLRVIKHSSAAAELKIGETLNPLTENQGVVSSNLTLGTSQLNSNMRCAAPVS